MTASDSFLTLAQAARLIASRQLSPVELAESQLQAIEALDPQVNAFITVTAELALDQARKAEAEIASGLYRGSMHGIPIGLKDLYDTAGILTSGHSKICVDRVPRENATAVSKLYAAGAVLLGKLASHELAQGGPATDLPWPPARNPWDNRRFTGGSSSGSGVAVAAGFVFGALGTDTGGSIRHPAALCGVVGLKPTYGLISRHGVIPNSYTFDTCGPMTWTVEDCAIMLQAVAGYDPKDPASANRAIPDYRAALTGDLRGLRVGVLRHAWEEDLPAHEEVCAAMENALSVLSDLGAKLETARMRPLQEYYDVKNTIALPELVAIHQADLIDRPGDFCADFLGRGGFAGALYSAVDYVQAQRARMQMLVEAQALYEKYDVLVCPANPGPAMRFEEYRTLGMWLRPNMTTPFNVTGDPALIVCSGFSKQGLPLSLQIVARPFGEETVLRAGHAFEQAVSLRDRRPQLTKGPPPAPLSLSTISVEAANLDEPTRKLAKALAERAGLSLGEPHLNQLYHAAPHAFAMAQRVPHRRNREDEPANVFRFPPDRAK
ncbi:MAG: amidase [Betaproteobacteria bacterium]|nr:amidase [Betaproteobacteria bacterium]